MSIWPLIKLVPKQTNFKFVRFAGIMSFVSLALVFLSFASFATGGFRENPIANYNKTQGNVVQKLGGVFEHAFNLGIDFKGGTVIEATWTKPVDLAQVRSTLGKVELKDIQVQGYDAPNQVMVRFLAPIGADASATVDAVKGELRSIMPGVTFPRVEVVGSKVSGELFTSGVMALVVALGLMMLYIWFRFEIQMGLGSVAALLHDVILTLGLMSVARLDFSLTSIAALLTIIGYSMNDTVVVYDRLRENMRKFKKVPMSDLIDLSTNETLSRTIITGSTALLALFGLTLIGGETIQSFTIAMIFGVVIGTYSSIYIAAPFGLLVPRGAQAKAQVVVEDRP